MGELPVFRSSLLLAGDRDAADVRRQLTRWTWTGKIVQLRRNVYMLAAPWRAVQPHPFLATNELKQPSYVSLEAALAHHGLIPESVPATTSVTTGRRATIETAIGRFLYHHLRPDAFFGYGREPLVGHQEALVADPAKALLDLVHLTPGGDTADLPRVPAPREPWMRSRPRTCTITPGAGGARRSTVRSSACSR